MSNASGVCPTVRIVTLTITLVAALVLSHQPVQPQGVRGSGTYRPEVVGRVGAVAAGRHFAAEAGMRMLARGGNAVDAGVAATFAAGVTEISHFGMGGEVPIILYLADRRDVLVISGQGHAPAAASADLFRRQGGIPSNGPSAGTVPAVIDALAIALAEFGTLSLAEVLAPAIALAEEGFPWYEFLTRYLEPQLERMHRFPSGARVYLQGPGGTIPALGSIFRQPDLARTLRALVEEEQHHLSQGRRAAIYAARDRFYGGDVGQRIAKAVQEAGGLLTHADLAMYRGRVERPTRITFRTRHGTFEVFKTGFWGQGPVLLQALALLQSFDLERMGHNSTEYIHTVTEALKLALADRDAFYGDPEFAKVPASGLLSETYAAERRKLIDPLAANNLQRPGDPWKFEPRSERKRPEVGRDPRAGGRERTRAALSPPRDPGVRLASPDTTTVNTADAKGNLFSASPSSAWFFGGVFIAGDTGVPLGNRMQAFVLEEGHPNIVHGGKRPRTTLTPTIVLRDGKPYLALSSPGGDSQDQQALQVFLNMAVFNMSPQAAIEAPRFNSFHHRRSFGDHRFMGGGLELEDRIPPGVVEALRRLGHRVSVVGPFMMDTGTTLVGVEPKHGTLFGAADLRRQRFVVGW
ncbi:MAG: gamma-glutamyltransferase family protein [Candidatus Rokubacteria bacterium]|nr:gamma-glutamyltransferase family protein [Candidatus Rokubacteria bacterium]